MKALARRLLKPLKPLAPPFVQQWSQKLLTDLEIDATPFEGFSKRAMMCVAETRFYRYDEHRAEKTRIHGWLTAKERQILYALGRWLPGPVTEIGSWCGLSTTAIARGVKDSGNSKEFRTYDLVVTENNFRPVDGGIGFFLPGNDVSHGTCSEEAYSTEILPVLRAGGANQLLKRNLLALGLANKVRIFTGDFREHEPVVSKVLFCDCLHDEREVEVNAPALKHWLRPGSILACHDLGQIPSLVAALRKKLPLGHGVSVDSIYLAEVV